MAEYLTASTHAELRGELTAYLTAPADKKQDILADLWARYGDRVKARAKL